MYDVLKTINMIITPIRIITDILALLVVIIIKNDGRQNND